MQCDRIWIMYFIKYIVCFQFIFTTSIKMITEWRANIRLWWLTGLVLVVRITHSLRMPLFCLHFSSFFFAKLLLCRYRLIESCFCNYLPCRHFAYTGATCNRMRDMSVDVYRKRFRCRNAWRIKLMHLCEFNGYA